MITDETLPLLRIASVADDGLDDQVEEANEPPELAATPARVTEDHHLDDLCEQLVWWCRTRRLYAKSSAPVSLLGRLGKRTRPLRPGGPDADCSAELSALYIAMVAQPADALDSIVFRLHYFDRVGNVKAAAGVLQIGRQHWYTLLREYRRRIFAASREILAMNDEARDRLPHLK